MLSWLLPAIGGFILASIGWAALFYKTAGTVALNSYDVFATILAFVSLSMNVIQWREARSLLVPVRNPLIGLFNELKARQGRVWGKQARITKDTTPLEFYDFTEEVLQGFEQLREHVISLIETVAPGLPDEDFFRASTRGLTPDEKHMRDDWIARRRREDRVKAAGASEPARMLFRTYEVNREARIIRGFAKGFEWTIHDLEPKAVVDSGDAETLEQAQADADRAAGTRPIDRWHSRP